MGLGLLLGLAKIPIGTSDIYLVGMVVLLMPLLLRTSLSILVGVVTVALTDVITGWAVNCWISIIAYGVGLVVLNLSKIENFKMHYLLALFIASLVIIFVYLFLMWIVWDLAFAVNGLIANIIQFIIVFVIIAALYKPMIKIKNIYL